MVEFKLAEFKMTAIIKLSQNEWVNFFCAKWMNPRWQNSIWLPSSHWFRINEWNFFCTKWSQWRKSVLEWIWEKITRCLNPRWQCLNPTWQNSRWPPSSRWVRMNEWGFFSAKWLNPWWQSSRWLPSSSWVRMNEFESDWTSLIQSFVQNVWMSEDLFCAEWLNPRWKISRWLPSLSSIRLN